MSVEEHQPEAVTASDEGVDGHAGLDGRVLEYWDWLAVALFLLTTVDLLTTLFAARVVGADGEANPLMQWALEQGLGVILAMNLLAVVLVAVFFYGLVEMLRQTPQPYDRYFAAGIEAWLGGLLAAGLLIFANNLAVIVLGRSLL